MRRALLGRGHPARTWLIAVCVLVWLVLPIGSVSADDPTPTPLPTLGYQELPTDTLAITPAPTPVIIEPATSTLSLDTGLWEYDNFQNVMSYGVSLFALANQYNWVFTLIGFVLAAGMMGTLYQFIKSRSQST